MSSIAREAGSLLMEHFREHVKIEYKGDAENRVTVGEVRRPVERIDVPAVFAALIV